MKVHQKVQGTNIVFFINGNRSRTHHNASVLSSAFLLMSLMSQVSNKSLKWDEKLNCQNCLPTENRKL